MRQRGTRRAAGTAVDPGGVHADEEPAVESRIPAADRTIAALGIKAFVGEHAADYATAEPVALAGIGRHCRARTADPRSAQGVLEPNLLAQGRLDSNVGGSAPYPGFS